VSRTWRRRIQRLESILRARKRPPAVFRYGVVTRLEKDPPGERHTVVSKSEPTALPNVERCEFEERLGPAPACESCFTVYLSLENEKPNPL
jgi:hypothetical protein